MMLKLTLSIAISMAAMASCFAGTVNFTQQVFIEGTPMINPIKCPPDKDGKSSCEVPITLGELCYYSLEREIPSQTWETAIKRDELAKAIRNAKDFVLLDDQSKLIEEAMGPIWPPQVLGEVNKMINTKP